MSDNKQDEIKALPAPLRRVFKVIDGNSGKEKLYTAQGKELQTKPEPTEGVKKLTDPTVHPGPPENWW